MFDRSCLSILILVKSSLLCGHLCMWHSVIMSLCHHVICTLCANCVCPSCQCHCLSVSLFVMSICCIAIACHVIMSNVIWSLSCYGQLVVGCFHERVKTGLVLWSGHLRFSATYLRLSLHFWSMCGLGCLHFSSENVNSCVWGYESLSSQNVKMSKCPLWS